MTDENKGKVDIADMDVMELMRHGGPDLVTEETERRIRAGADPLHCVLGADPQGKLAERSARLREECAPSAIILMLEQLQGEAEDDIPAFLRKAPPVGATSMAKTFARGGYVPTQEGGEAVMPKAAPKRYMHEASVKDLLLELKSRGDTFSAVAQAQLLVLKKSVDYNGHEIPPTGTRDVYFPFGNTSYAHMIHTKSQRLVSLVGNESKGVALNFEGVKDTALDLINYAAFLVEFIDRNPF